MTGAELRARMATAGMYYPWANISIEVEGYTRTGLAVLDGTVEDDIIVYWHRDGYTTELQDADEFQLDAYCGTPCRAIT